MTSQSIIGILVLLGGIALLVVGLNASHSLADNVSNTFTGRFTQETTWYIIGGIAVGIFGLSLLFTGFRGNRA